MEAVVQLVRTSVCGAEGESSILSGLIDDRWCKGSTLGFDPGNPGSTPGRSSSPERGNVTRCGAQSFSEDNARMSGDHDTKELEIPTADRVAELTATRMGLCLLACADIDEYTLRLLGTRNKDGRTNLQHILDHVTWPARKE